MMNDDPAKAYAEIKSRERQLNRDDAHAVIVEIRSEVDRWLKSKIGANAGGAAKDLARQLVADCDLAERHHQLHGVPQRSGLHLRLTPARLVELGYVLARFRERAYVQIPQDKQTVPMEKSEALIYIGWPTKCQNERQALYWLNQSINDGSIPAQATNSRKRWIFSLDSFPPEAWQEIRRK